MVITGAGEGIMKAGQDGAGRERSFGVNIRLPFEQEANEVILNDPKLVTFRYFFTRKLVFVKETDAIALFPGGFGTMDEAFETLTLLQTGKSALLPLVCVDRAGDDYWRSWDAYVRTTLLSRGLIAPEDLALYRVTDRLDEAVDEILTFYRNYHSSRYVGNRLVIRLRHAPTAMTGHQEHPGTGRTLLGEDTITATVEDFGRACGMKNIATVDPYDLQATTEVIRRALDSNEPTLIVARSPCPLYTKKSVGPARRVDQELCTKCKACLRLGCPAIEWANDEIHVNELLCGGCALCEKVCKEGAFAIASAAACHE